MIVTLLIIQKTKGDDSADSSTRARLNCIMKANSKFMHVGNSCTSLSIMMIHIEI